MICNGRMKPGEWYFYAAVGVVVLLSELSVRNGYLLCLVPPMLFVTMAIGFWVFKKEGSRE